MRPENTEVRIGELQHELKATLLEQATDVLFDPTGFEGAPNAIFTGRLINIEKILAREELRDRLVRIARVQLEAIREATPFDMVVAVDKNAQLFWGYLARELPSIPEPPIREPAVLSPSHDIRPERFDNLMFPPSAHVLVLTDIVSSGVVCSRLIDALAPRKVVGILSMFHLIGGTSPTFGHVPFLTSLSLKYDEIDRLVPDDVRLKNGKVLFQAGELSFESYPVVTSLRDEAKRYFSKHPEKVRNLSPRGFEELVADILADLGFTPELTKVTRDGGVDIYAYLKSEVSMLMVVECKKWHPDNRVGIDVVQRLYGVQQSNRANKALLVTTSFFSVPAITEAARYGHWMDLADFDGLKRWLAKYGPGQNDGPRCGR